MEFPLPDPSMRSALMPPSVTMVSAEAGVTEPHVQQLVYQRKPGASVLSTSIMFESSNRVCDVTGGEVVGADSSVKSLTNTLVRYPPSMAAGGAASMPPSSFDASPV